MNYSTNREWRRSQPGLHSLYVCVAPEANYEAYLDQALRDLVAFFCQVCMPENCGVVFDAFAVRIEMEIGAITMGLFGDSGGSSSRAMLIMSAMGEEVDELLGKAEDSSELPVRVAELMQHIIAEVERMFLENPALLNGRRLVITDGEEIIKEIEP